MLIGKMELLWILLLLFRSTATLKVYPPEQVAYLGRWFSDRGTSKRCSWGTVSFAVAFRGSSQLVARLQPYNVVMYHTCQVNDETPFTLEHERGDLVINGLDPAQSHRIHCGRNTEAYYGETIVDALLVDEGAVTLAPPRPSSNQLAVEFVGDSITAGWKVLLPARSLEQGGPRNEDAFKTWAANLAKAWGTTNWRTVAQSSIGVLPHQSHGVNFKGMKDQFLCSELTLYQPCQRPWNFEWQADVVVINLGTNDFIFNNPTKETFQSAYAELIRTVRDKYPNALIFCIVPLVQSCKTDAKWQKMVQGIQDAVASAGTSVELVPTPGPQSRWLNCASEYVDEIHPTEQGGLLLAQHLSSLMTPKLRETFPWKCGSGCGEVPSTTGSIRSTTLPAATAPTTPTPTGGALCCYPGCNAGDRTCNDEAESPYCTRSASNCQNCGGELCGAPGSTTPPTTPSTTPSPTPSTTPSMTTTTTEPLTTTTEGATTPGGGATCCYPDCGSSVCNPSDNYCSQSTRNCRNCGGTLCGESTSSAPRTTESSSTSTAESTTGSEDSRCCYPDCSTATTCNEPEDSPFCTSSPENCRKCGGELCSGRGHFL